MRAIIVMFDSLNRKFLEPYGCDFTKTPNFNRLKQHTVQFDTCYAGSLPCMPARRELHTGRYNFLHRSWGPIEPFDDSMPAILKSHGIHAHLVSDHGHYWEDGGATYHQRYNTWENFRGQEDDHWKGLAGGLSEPVKTQRPVLPYRERAFMQDQVNRTYLQDEKDHPQVKTFDAGLAFINDNIGRDQWFLQIEAFDPHEPFFTYEKYRELYPHDYQGAHYDWPDYAKVTEGPEEVEHIRCQYAALLSMCDGQLGRVLDMMDKHDLWRDTLLIVNTDHGFLLGEHGFWAKNYMPMYEEISHTPLFIWDPRFRVQNERRQSLVQTIDIPATMLEYFGIRRPQDMQGQPLKDVITNDQPVREAALFGTHGAHICCTDGRYVYMKSPQSSENKPLHEYTLMPTHMDHFFSGEELKTMQYHDPLPFTKEIPVMRFDVNSYVHAFNYGDLLFDLTKGQDVTIQDEAVRDHMERLMIQLMKENDAPAEQFERVGLKA